jgi:hypothetical protein
MEQDTHDGIGMATSGVRNEIDSWKIFAASAEFDIFFTKSLQSHF